MDLHQNANYTMLCDFYEITMGGGYFSAGLQDRIAYFDIFFRSVPAAGTGQLFEQRRQRSAFLFR